jgi:hypothetical protein
MSDVVEPTIRRWRPRFSLLNLFLFATIVCLAVALWRSQAHLKSVTQEVLRLRAEMGQVYVSDPNKVHAIQVRQTEDGSSRWRLYLPPGRTFAIHCYCGQYPWLKGQSIEQWLKGVTAHYYCAGTESGGLLSGELTLDAILVKKNDQWHLQIPPIGEESVYTSDDWLSDSRTRFTWGKVGASEQSVFERGEPILLECIQKGIMTPLGGSGFSIAPPAGPVDSVVLWIDENPNP